MSNGSSDPTALAAEIEQTRERLAHTIDQLMFRASPKTIVSRQVADVKGFFVDPVTGEPQTQNILKVVGGVVGLMAVLVVLRKITS